MYRTLEKSLIGVALLYITYHLLGYLSIFLNNFGFITESAMMDGIIFGMFLNIPIYYLFAIINLIIYSIVRRKIKNWPMYLNIMILFFIFVLFLRRTDFGLFYWLRYCIAFMPLFLINSIVGLQRKIKLLIILSPFVVLILMMLAHAYII